MIDETGRAEKTHDAVEHVTSIFSFKQPIYRIDFGPQLFLLVN